MSHDPEDWCKIWRKTDVVSKMTRICWNLTPVFVCVTPALICSYCAKYSMFHLKRYMGVVFHGTEEWCKIGRKTDLFKKWHEKFGKFSPERLKVSKLGLWWDQNLQRSYVSWQWRIMQNLTQNWLVISKPAWGI